MYVVALIIVVVVAVMAAIYAGRAMIHELESVDSTPSNR
jgi:hypothetical protein